MHATKDVQVYTHIYKHKTLAYTSIYFFKQNKNTPTPSPQNK